MIRSLVIGIVLVLVVVGLLFIPIRVPFYVETPGKVLPAREWILLRDTNGALAAVLRNHLNGDIQSYGITPERGDAMRFKLNEQVLVRSVASSGETVASVFSSETERRIVELTGNLEAARASVGLYSTGEKESLVKEARERIARAEELSRQQKKIVDRLSVLASQKLVPDQDLEVAQSALAVYDSDVSIAHAQLEALETGAKPQQLQLTRTQVNALENNLSSLRRRLDYLNVSTPIPGIVSRSFTGDTLLTVNDTSRLVVVMPVLWKDEVYLEPGQDVKVESRGFDASGKVRDVGSQVLQFQGDQVLLVTAHLGGNKTGIKPGALVSCRITCGRVTLFEFVKRSLSTLWS